MSLNKVFLIERIGKDVEIVKLDNGIIAKTSLATTEKYTNRSGEKVEDTEWHNLTFFGKTAEIAEKYVKKGDLISVVGKIKTRKWQDKDGNDRYTTDIVVNELVMLGSKNATHTSDDKPEYKAGSKIEEYAEGESDDLPF